MPSVPIPFHLRCPGFHLTELSSPEFVWSGFETGGLFRSGEHDVAADIWDKSTGAVIVIGEPVKTSPSSVIMFFSFANFIASWLLYSVSPPAPPLASPIPWIDRIPAEATDYLQLVCLQADVCRHRWSYCTPHSRTSSRKHPVSASMLHPYSSAVGILGVARNHSIINSEYSSIFFIFPTSDAIYLIAYLAPPSLLSYLSSLPLLRDCIRALCSIGIKNPVGLDGNDV